MAGHDELDSILDAQRRASSFARDHADEVDVERCSNVRNHRTGVECPACQLGGPSAAVESS